MIETKKSEQEYAEIFNEMISFIESHGITVNTKTKARGHQGFYLKDRIDISSNLGPQRKIEVLIHEFSHYMHAKIDPSIYKNHGNLETLFPGADIKKLEEEMLRVTGFVDKNLSLHKLGEHREIVLCRIKELDKKIKSEYPDFKRSYPYKHFEKAIKKTDAKYLLKYDRVRVKALFLGKNKDYSIKTIDEDFPQLEEQVRNFLRIKSEQRTLKRIAGRIGRLKAYYRRPSELFARLVEGLFIDTNKVTEIAPYAYLVFCKELTLDRFPELADFINNFF